MLIKAQKKIDTTKIDQEIKQQKKKNFFHAKKYKSKVEWGEDALEYQKRVRNERD